MTLLTRDRIGALLLGLFCVAYWATISDIRLLPFQANQAFTPRTLPQVLAWLGTALSLAILVAPSRADDDAPDWRALNWPLGLAFLVLMSAYGFTVRPLGFLLATSAFLMIGFAMLGERSPVKLIAVAVPLVVAFWVLMTQGLSVWIEPLPEWLR